MHTATLSLYFLKNYMDVTETRGEEKERERYVHVSRLAFSENGDGVDGLACSW